MTSDIEGRLTFSNLQICLERKDYMGADSKGVLDRITSLVGTKYKAKQVLAKFSLDVMHSTDVSEWLHKYLNIAAYFSGLCVWYRKSNDNWDIAIDQLSLRAINYSEKEIDSSMEEIERDRGLGILLANVA